MPLPTEGRSTATIVRGVLAILGILTIPVYIGVVVLIGVGISLRRTYPAPRLDRQGLRTSLTNERAHQRRIANRWDRAMAPGFDPDKDERMPGLAEMASSKNGSPLNRFLYGSVLRKVTHGLKRCTWFPIRDLVRELRR